MKRYLITILLSAFMALSVSSQYYSKTFFNEGPYASFIHQAIPMDNESILFNAKSKCDSVPFCGNLSKFKRGFEYESILNTQFEQYSVNSLKYNEQNIFISSYNKSLIDNKSYWYYKMLDSEGSLLISTKYEMPIPFNPFNINYGLELVKDDEIILWGNGFDPSVDNVNDSIKVVWLRINKDGRLLSGPNYFKPYDTQDFGIAVDATTNSDGNMVFIRENFDWDIGLFRCIYEIDENDKVSQISKIDANVREYDYARMCSTQDGNYIMSTAAYDRYNAPPKFYKINSLGDVLWTCSLPALKSSYLGDGLRDNVNHTEIRRIREMANGDIVFCGTNSFIDSIYNYKFKRKVLMSDWAGAFFGRISVDGNLKWVHYMVSPKNYTECHYIIPEDVNEMPNGDLILGGAIGTSPDSLDLTFRTWLLRVNDKGCFDDDCSHVDKWWYFPEEMPISTIDLPKYDKTLVLGPNPFRNYTTLMLPNDTVFPIFYQITNMAGQMVSQGTQETNISRIETNHFASGAYIVLCKDKNGKVFYQKGVKI